MTRGGAASRAVLCRVPRVRVRRGAARLLQGAPGAASLAPCVRARRFHPGADGLPQPHAARIRRSRGTGPARRGACDAALGGARTRRPTGASRARHVFCRSGPGPRVHGLHFAECVQLAFHHHSAPIRHRPKLAPRPPPDRHPPGKAAVADDSVSGGVRRCVSGGGGGRR